jgi:NAD(P)-dependent dehydrogenase (short-subunit alcohol dehydrogenase family)
MSTELKNYPKGQPAQHQDRQPGLEHEMQPQPVSQDRSLEGGGRLKGAVAVITGGDSGIGRATAIAFAREGAEVAVLYLNEHRDAEETKRLVEEHGRHCECISGDAGSEEFCQSAVKQVLDRFGKIDVLVNNAAEQSPKDSILDIDSEQLESTFRTNVYSFFYLTKAALPHLREGSSIINTTSVTAYRGSPGLLDYSATKGAIVAFTRSLALSLADQGIRVNGVAPGPIWTPLIPSTFSEEKVAQFGTDTPMKRAGQPEEVASCFVFLASSESSYMSGQILHPNGGEIING